MLAKRNSHILTLYEMVSGILSGSFDNVINFLKIIALYKM